MGVIKLEQTFLPHYLQWCRRVPDAVAEIEAHPSAFANQPDPEGG
jgi:hypothetical protein